MFSLKPLGAEVEWDVQYLPPPHPPARGEESRVPAGCVLKKVNVGRVLPDRLLSLWKGLMHLQSLRFTRIAKNE